MKTIPEKKVLICDVCGTTDETPFRFKTRAHLTLKQDALDYQGSPCADATRRLDLCDNCASRIASAIAALTRLASESHQEGLNG